MDLEKNQCVRTVRDTREKVFVFWDELETAIPAQLECLCARTCTTRSLLITVRKRTRAATTMDEVMGVSQGQHRLHQDHGAATWPDEDEGRSRPSSRCMPFEQEHLSDVCPCCGKPAKTMVYWGIAY